MRIWIVCSLTCLLSLTANAASDSAECPVVRIETERLPDLNIPRAGHAMFYANGELTVAGGHTDGFVPTPTAEYFKDGKWHTLQMTYTHDFGISAVLRSGKVLLAGGCEQPTGIGQTFTAELYDPKAHTFRGFGNMEKKRAWASAIELDSGQVVIAGNWYHGDGIETFHENQSDRGDSNDKRSFTYIKDVAAERSLPYIFRMPEGDALIIGINSTKGEPFHCTFADRLKGDTVHIPLFETWQPLAACSHDDTMSAIGDESKGDFTYLLPVKDSTGQVAIARVCGTDIKLVPTACPIPMRHQGNHIVYTTSLIVDRQAGRAYMIGYNTEVNIAPEKVHLYILAVDYAHPAADGKMPLTLYYLDSPPMMPDRAPLLTPEGNLLIAGGMVNCSNFTPSTAVWLLRLGRSPEYSTADSVWWLWPLAAFFIIGALGLLIYWRRSRRSVVQTSDSSDDALLMERINQLMETQKLYLNSDLKVGDLADALDTNRTTISSCINGQHRSSFSQYVNTYRINHAKELMRRQPDIKIVEVWTSSGFATESYFFRSFKAITGMTPSDWKQNND